MYGQLKSRLWCKVCDNESNTFDPFLALSVPIPKATTVNVKITYYPVRLSEGDQIREVLVEAWFKDTLKDIMENFWEEIKCPPNIKFYRRSIDKWGDFKSQDLLKLDTSAKEFIENSIGAYAYNEILDAPHQSVLEVRIMHDPKQKYQEEKDLCAPKLFFLNYEETKCRDLKILIFDYVFDIINKPEELIKLLEPVTEWD